MEADLQAHVAFYLTGKKLSSHLDAVEGLKLHPALFSSYRDLTRLRYDFPLVLVKDRPEGLFVEPLSGLIDAILDKIANGDNGERIRKHVLRLEQEIRALVAGGASGLFSALWDQAAKPLVKADKQVAESLSLARANLKVDGVVIDCDAAMPFHLLGHAWGITQTLRARKFGADISRLILKLSNIIKADFVNSNAGKSAENLKAAFGSGPMDHFDFEAMSRILSKSYPKENLSKSRRRRVLNLISTLQSQKFFPTSAPDEAGTLYSFAFDTCSSALKAYRERLPQAIELAKAIAVAELEIKGEYNESMHDSLFKSFGENGLDTRDLSRFPDYLVRVNASDLTGSEQNTLTDILSADLPIKILVQTDDVIEESSIDKGHLAFSLRNKQLAGMALGLGGVFVLQSPASSLYQLRTPIQRGLDYPGPALFSIFSGATKTTGDLPPYLVGAAALESRAFPAFTFDPSAGGDWASRFSLAENPQAGLDWPLHVFSYQNEASQRVSERIPFTLIDFVACDSRYSKHFASVPKTSWNETLVPVEETIAREGRGQLDTVPCMMMVDPENRLQKVIVDEKLIREARRCRTMWNSLQELGGIHNSHAEKLLASEKKIWEETFQPASVASPAETASVAVTSAVAAPVVATSVPVEQEQEPERSPDEAYIETARCSSCNECFQINNKMFAYDGNKQAYIADVNAGTYAQLVEAAENCQVSIIHPGKPRNPDEPGLEDLLKRAELFQ
jgi:hypothetical protein